MDLSSYVFSALREGELSLYRGRQHGNPLPLLAVALAAEHPSAQSLRRLEHEYSLAPDLDPAWAARPLALTRHAARTMLVLNDPGGEPLDRVLDRVRGQPLELTRFLRIAIGLAVALRQVHARGLIHKDIKPANVLVDGAGNVWLTGFGIASRLPRESQAPAPPEVIAGTLAYMAPEQTGRMNRSIDARSDLYSLGVTLYEMLTGALPFAAADPLEWVHCHIARRPIPPGERVTVPGPLSTIVMKLLAKNAEERYQTASGLETDLRRCLAQWESHGRIDAFPLGEHDASDRFRIPEKLYGREHEIDALLTAFDRVVADGTPELVLVSGYSGIGKSSVVNELHKALVAPRGLFASGKFDQYKRDIPYATLAQAFRTLVRQILAKDDAQVAHWRHALTDAVGPNGQLMVNLIPELEFVIGKQPPVAELPPRDEKHRFQRVFRSFLGAFARPEHPLALFLDDLQWLDAATLELLEHVVTDWEMRHLLLVGAYRDNEVSASHPLMRTLAAVRQAGAQVQDIVLAPLALDDVGRLVADALHAEQDSARPLAQLVREKTDGNPFFAIQFLMALAEEGLFAFDADAATWTWDLARIHAKGFTDNVVELMIGKLKRLPDTTQDALKQLACLGNVAEFATLALFHAGSEEEIHSALWEAVEAGLVVRLETAYKFLHDRIQQAAYSLIPEEHRAGVHLRIGRRLAAGVTADGLAEHVFEIVNQLNRGAALIDLLTERQQAASLNLMAGRRARAATAYVSALNYFAAGAALLQEEDWTREYPLTFALEFHRAECEFLTGDLAAADGRFSTLSRRAATPGDCAAVTCARVVLYTTLDRPDRAIDVGLACLRDAGIDWPEHPTPEALREECARIWQQLGNRPIEALVDLPLMRDPHQLAAMDVLTELIIPAVSTDPCLEGLIVGRMTNISLEHGNSHSSCFAYAHLALVLSAHFGNYRAGFRFGMLALDLVDTRGLDGFKGRVFKQFGAHVNPWTRHLDTGRALVRQAFDVALACGDLTFAAYSSNAMISIMLASGDPLADVQRESEHSIAFTRNIGLGRVIDILTTQLALVHTLRGVTPRFGSFDDGDFDERRFGERLDRDRRLVLPACWYWIRKLQARVFAGDYASAVDAAEKARPMLWVTTPFLEIAEYHFYGALARAAHYDDAPADDRHRHLEALAAHHKQLDVWAENCPENFANRAALVAAEIARLEGRDLDAMRLYEQAIQSAREHGFVQNEALAHETAARFFLARGLETIGLTYLRHARSGYDRWGALGKVKQLDATYPHLHVERTDVSLAATIGARVEQLDVETVVKASQALSSEIVLPRLIETLMRIAVEHAGAERGLLILLRGDEPQIEAEATIGRGRIEVAVRQAAVTSSDLPPSVLHYVIRTRTRVILEDASVGSVYSEDAYVQHKYVRSLLCLPIVKQTKLIGVLYLENNLTPRAFTADRVAVLELLASQAAISLENARLYSELQRSETFLAEGQRISATGSFGWNVRTGTIYWSKESYRIFGLDPATTPTVASIVERVHPDDRSPVQDTITRAATDGAYFDIEHRLVMPDGVVKHIRVAAHAERDDRDDVYFVGAVVDLTETKRAEEALRQAQAHLAHVSRVTTMGELTASLSHEVKQPIAAAVTDANTCVRWLAHDPPNVGEARDAALRVVQDGRRATEIISRIRLPFTKGAPEWEWVDVNELIQEMTVLLRGEAARYDVAVRATLAADLPPVMADRVQLQQVLMNLILNGIDAMKAVEGARDLAIISQRGDGKDLLVSVSDTGVGLPSQQAEQIFKAFFTTKADGLGMGLSISRSIVEAHGGRLWAADHAPRGATLCLTLPVLG